MFQSKPSWASVLLMLVSSICEIKKKTLKYVHYLTGSFTLFE